jgi:hypothetical protein
MNCKVAIHHIYDATQLQLSQNDLFSTMMQLHDNCTHDVMFTSLIVIHLFKFDTWHYEGI